MPSIREIAAEKIAKRFIGSGDNIEMRRNRCAEAIEQAIRNERERCAKITDSRAEELQRMAMAPLLDDETVARFRCQSAVCNELTNTIRKED